MTQKLLRFAYVCEFLLALLAIFTAWSEIGGQAALDIMHWGWKLGFAVGLAFAVVRFTASYVSAKKVGKFNGAGWLLLILLLTAAMGVVTYYYTVQEQSGESDEPADTVTIYYPCAPMTGNVS
jgi:hypothetical protein